MSLTKATKVDITSWCPEALYEEVCELVTPLAISLRSRFKAGKVLSHARSWVKTVSSSNMAGVRGNLRAGTWLHTPLTVAFAELN